jgi:hypothetical protein
MCIKIKNKIFLSSQINVHGYGVQRHFQQYFSYIVASVLLVEYPEKTIDLPQVTDKLDHIM